MPWYVIYTKAKQELKVTEKLLQNKIECYCPTVTTIKQWSDRKKKVTQPLLSSYVFVKVKDIDRHLVFEVSGVVRYVYWLGKPAKISNKEIETLKQQVEGHVFSKIDIKDLKPNMKLNIPEGMFKDYEGVVNKVSNNKIFITLQSVGFQLILEF